MHPSKQNVLSVPTKWQPWKQSNRAPCHGGFPFIWCWSHLLWSLCIPVTVSYLSPPTTPSCKLYAFHMVIIWDFPDFQSSLFFPPSQVLLIKKRTSSVVAFCVAVQKNKKNILCLPISSPHSFPFVLYSLYFSISLPRHACFLHAIIQAAFSLFPKNKR